MVFGNNISKLDNHIQRNNLTLKSRGAIIERVSTFKYLGITLDERLTFEPHIQNTINGASIKLQQLRNVRRYLTKKAALLVYKNMILPIVEYGDIYMSSTTKKSLKKLQVIQNKALRCALNHDPRSDTGELHYEEKLKKLKHRRKEHMLLHMYQISQNKVFKGWKKKTSINTRSSQKKLMVVKKPNSSKFRKSVTYLGPKYWNSLPTDIQQSDSYPLFKSKLHAHLDNNQKK